MNAATAAGFGHADGVGDWRSLGGAADLGLTGEPAVRQTLRVRVDAVGIEPVTSFWRTVLGHDGRGDSHPARSFA